MKLMALHDTNGDIVLWNQSGNGDTESFVSIFRNFYSDLFNYGRKITDDHTIIEDCIPDLFIDLRRTAARLKSFQQSLFFQGPQI
jgi:hypothetical protein